MRFVVIILTSTNLRLLELSYDTVISQKSQYPFDIIINVNTKRDGYYTDVKKAFKNRKTFELARGKTGTLRILKTDSNGRPGRGHNSCITVFSQNPQYDYMIMLDGDDYFYPRAFHQMDKVFSLNPPTDIMMLLGGDRIEFAQQSFKTTTLPMIESQPYNGSNKIETSYNFGVRLKRDFADLPDDHDFSINHVKLNNKDPYIYGLGKDGSGTPSRLLMISRKALDVLDKYGAFYDEEMYIYDDFKAFYIAYELHLANDSKIVARFVYDNHIHLYNNCHTQSVSFSGREDEDRKHYKNDVEFFKSVPNALQWDLDRMRITVLNNSDRIDKYKSEFVNDIVSKIIDNANIPTTYKGGNHGVVVIDMNPGYSFKKMELGEPCGGTETAILNLLREVKIQGYSPYLMTLSPDEYTDEYGIRYLQFRPETFFNVLASVTPGMIIIQGGGMYISQIRDKFPTVRIICWTQHDINVVFAKNIYQKLIDSPLNNHPDRYIFVSQWQMNRYRIEYKIPEWKCILMRNAVPSHMVLNRKKTRAYIPTPVAPIGSATVNALTQSTKQDQLTKQDQSTKQDQLTQEHGLPIMIYTAAPYRGLTLLKEIFVRVKRQIPDAQLWVFSSFSRDQHKTLLEDYSEDCKPIKNIEKLMERYPENSLDHMFMPYYKNLIETEGISFYGSVSQKVLFNHLDKALVHVYPCVYPETCCTSILESMASSCNVVTTNLGALPETSQRLIDLVDLPLDVELSRQIADDYVRNPVLPKDIPAEWFDKFANRVVMRIREYYTRENSYHLEKQLDYIKYECNWHDKVRDTILPLFDI